MMDSRQPIYGAKECAAEILMQASKRLGRPMSNGISGPVPMDLADAIADCSINNPEGAIDAFRVMHKATGAENLRAWASKRSHSEVGVFMRRVARKLAQ